MADSAKPARRRGGAGYSIPAAAEALGVPYKTLRKAIELKQAKTILFGAQERMPSTKSIGCARCSAGASLTTAPPEKRSPPGASCRGLRPAMLLGRLSTSGKTKAGRPSG